MKRRVAVALATLIAMTFTIPACAQRGASRGGFSGHSAPAFRGGFSGSAPRSFIGAPRYAGRSPLSSSPRFLGAGPRNFVSRSSYDNNAIRRRRFYPSRYGYGFPYLGAGWIPPGYLDSGYSDYPDEGPYDDSQAPPNYDAGYDYPPPNAEQPPPPAPFYPSYPSYPQPPQASSPLPDEEAVTLIFKDGRPPEQIRNYAMTRTTLYVRDQHHRDIPLDQLDLDATQKVNRVAGVDFQLPELSK